MASTQSHSGVASYHGGVWLGSTGWLITSDGRGQHGIRLHESSPVNQASKTQGYHIKTHQSSRRADERPGSVVCVSSQESSSLGRAGQREGAFYSGLVRQLGGKSVCQRTRTHRWTESCLQTSIHTLEFHSPTHSGE